MSPAKARMDVVANLSGEFSPPIAISYNIAELIYPVGGPGLAADWHHIIWPGDTSYPTHQDYEKQKL